MGMYDQIRVDTAEMPENWRGRVLQTKDLLDLTSGGWDSDNQFVVLPDKRLVRGETWEGPWRDVDYTGYADGCDFDPPGDTNGPLLNWRMTFVAGRLVTLQGPWEWLAGPPDATPPEDGKR